MSSQSSQSSTPPVICTPEELRESANRARSKSIPAKSSKRYHDAYNAFKNWQNSKNIGDFISESTLLAYFEHLSQTKSPNMLWSIWAMIKCIVKAHHRKNIAKYTEVFSFLKANSKGHVPLKAKVFSPQEIDDFMMQAPDLDYLDKKVILIFGLMGACRSCELVDVTINDVEMHGKMFLVKIPTTKTGVSRSFTISDHYFDIVEKYRKLRPNNMKSDRFFIQYRKGKCIAQVIGKNQFPKVPGIIANFLKLEEPNRYTGHSFRRTSTTLLANSGANIETIKRHGAWKSDAVATGYIDDSVTYKQNTEKLIKRSLSNSLSHPVPVTSTPARRKNAASTSLKHASLRVTKTLRNNAASTLLNRRKTAAALKLLKRPPLPVISKSKAKSNAVSTENSDNDLESVINNSSVVFNEPTNDNSDTVDRSMLNNSNTINGSVIDNLQSTLHSDIVNESMMDDLQPMLGSDIVPPHDLAVPLNQDDDFDNSAGQDFIYDESVPVYTLSSQQNIVYDNVDNVSVERKTQNMVQSQGNLRDKSDLVAKHFTLNNCSNFTIVFK